MSNEFIHVNNGFVSLVGAGPGDPELLTIKGLRRLEQADVVLYDRLSPKGLLAKAPVNAELIFAGDRETGKNRDQDWINSIMIEKAKLGKKVVRLKGGDPFVFGRGGEEAEALEKAGVNWEVVPGVTSPISVLAYSGIPITDRRFSTSFAVVSGHIVTNRESSAPWIQLAGKVGTLVCVMATEGFGRISKDLLAEGLDPNTPSAIVQSGTTADQRTITGPLKNIASIAKNAKVKHPSIFVIGNTVPMVNQLAWYEKRPLFGLRVFIDIDSNNNRIAEKLLDQGADVIEIRDFKQSDPHVDTIKKMLNIGAGLVCYNSKESVYRMTTLFKEFLNTPTVIIGEETSKIAKELGLNIVAKLDKDLDSLIESLIKWHESGNHKK